MKHSRSMPAVGLVFIVCAAGFADPAPRLEPDAFLASLGEGGEPLPLGKMIDAALAASGAAANEASMAAERIGVLIDDMKTGINPEWNDRQIAEYVLTYLHGRLFFVYDEFQTRVDKVLFDGSFNCVSSAVLYMIFARSVNIPVVGIGASDHAFCAAILSDEKIDVETTNIYGFDPGTKREFHDAFGNVTGYSYVPPSEYDKRIELSERELLALILQNRVSMLESEKKYAEAVGLAVDRYALAPGELTREHLTLEVINYAALLNERGEYKEATEFLTTFVDSYGWDESLKGIYGVLHYNQIVVLIQSEAFADAIEIMAELEVPGWIDPAVLEELRLQVGERILARDLPPLTPSEGLTLLDALREEGLISTKRHLDFAVMLYSQEADGAAAMGEYLDAASSIDRAIEILGPDGRLLSARQAYRHNFAVEAHNAFASLYNDGKYDEARNLLIDAIEKVPENDILLEDLSALRQVLSKTQ